MSIGHFVLSLFVEKQPLVKERLPYGAKFSRNTIFADFTGGFSTAKIALRETWLDRLIIRIFIRSTPFRAVVWLHLQSCVQTMSLVCYFSPVRADQKLPVPQGALTRDVLSSLISAANMQRWSACRVNSTIPQSRKGSRTQSSWMYKGWDSKASSRARDSFNHPLFCKDWKQRSHVLVDMIAAHHRLHAKRFAPVYVAFGVEMAPNSYPFIT